MNFCYQLKLEGHKPFAGAPATCNFQPATFNRSQRALTLLEMMVAVTLLAVIMVGLLAMFQYTQRALHAAHMQTDVFENARAAIQLITRDISEMADYGEPNFINNVYVTRYDSPVMQSSPPGLPPLGDPITFHEAFWLTQANDKWQGLAYYVDGAQNYGVGTLYRFSQTTNRLAARGLFNAFRNSTDFHRVSDGVVHFHLTAVYPTIDTNNNNRVTFLRTRLLDKEPFTFPSPAFESNTLPAFIDFEIGVLEPATLKQFNSLTGNVAVAKNFLRDHVGKIHFFRERVPIHNFLNPYRADEVQ